MVSQQLEEIMKKLDTVTKKQDKYEKLFLKYEQDTAGTSFTGKTERSDQQEKLVELSTLIDSIKDEIGRLAKATEKQKKSSMTWNSMDDRIVSFYIGTISITG